MTSRSKTLASILGSFTPCVVRMLARKGKGAGSVQLTHIEVAHASGLALAKVRRISRLTSWDSVTVGDADKFMRGCGINIATLWRHRAFLRRTLDPRQTKTPLHFATSNKKHGAPNIAPPPTTIVNAAID